MEYSYTVLDCIVFIWLILHTQAFQEATVQTCENEVFEARCPFQQNLLITQARFGAIESSRCVDEIFAELGLLGCYANVTELIGSRCNKQTRCTIDGEDPEVVSSKSCKKGLSMYMDISYVCLPGILSMQSCSTISVNRQMQYLLSKDIWDLHCFYDLEQNVNVELSSENNLKIAINMQRVAGSVQTSSDDEVMVQYGDGDSIALREETLELETDHLTLTLTSMQSVLLIGFKAFGCDNPATPAYAWVSREGDVATIGCYHSEYEWKLSCVGSKWIGSRSNCTDKQQETTKPTPTPDINNPRAERRTFLTTDILFALIIGLTILLCAIVITIGYVCLKRSKYTYEAKSSPYEMTSMMSDPSNPGTWQKAKLQGNNDTLILPVNSLQGQTLQLR